MPVKDLDDEKAFPTTSFFLATKRKPSIKHFRTFGCRTIFKRYEMSKEVKIVKNKYTQ